MTSLLIAFLLQISIALPDRVALDNPALSNPVPKQLQKDYDKVWKRFQSGKEDAKVLADSDKLLKRNPAANAILIVEAYIDLYAGRLNDTERKLTTVLSRNPSDSVALYYLAELAYSRSDFVRATELYARLRTANPSASAKADAKRQRALLLAMDALLRDARRAIAENRLADAERLYRQALALAPREGALRGQLAETLSRQGKQAEADEEIRLQRQLAGSSGTPLVSERIERPASELEDLGRWGAQIERFLEMRAAAALTREQLAALLAGYFPQLLDLQQTPDVITDVQDSWAGVAIQTVVGAGVLDATPSHTFQPARTVSRGEFAQAVARLIRLLGVSPAEAAPTSPVDVVPNSPLYLELQPVLGYELLSLDNAGAFNVGAPVRGEEAVNTAEKLLRLIRKKAA